MSSSFITTLAARLLSERADEWPAAPAALTMVGRAARVFARSWWQVLCITSLVYAPLELGLQVAASVAGRGGQSSALWLLAARAAGYAVAGALTAQALVYVFKRAHAGAADAGVREALAFGYENLARAIVYRTMATLLVLAGAVLIVIPGLFILVMSVFVDQVVALEPEEGNPWSRSRELTAGLRTTILAAGAVLALVYAFSMMNAIVALNALAGGPGGIKAAGAATVLASSEDTGLVRLLLRPAVEILKQLTMQSAAAVFCSLAYEFYVVARERES